jgi:DNA repair exonuclease SbcCD ATPase subunit
MKCRAAPDAELQKFIKEQLHSLQTEMLRYEYVTAENRETHELNASLKTQLEAQQQHFNRLDKQLKSFQQAEINFKAQYDQLECDLNEPRDALPVNTSELEQEVFDLRQQLKKVEEDLGAANTKVEKIERESDTYKVTIIKLVFIGMVLTTSRAITKTSRRSCRSSSRSLW